MIFFVLALACIACLWIVLWLLRDVYFCIKFEEIFFFHPRENFVDRVKAAEKIRRHLVFLAGQVESRIKEFPVGMDQNSLEYRRKVSQLDETVRDYLEAVILARRFFGLTN